MADHAGLVPAEVLAYISHQTVAFLPLFTKKQVEFGWFSLKRVFHSVKLAVEIDGDMFMGCEHTPQSPPQPDFQGCFRVSGVRLWSDLYARVHCCEAAIDHGAPPTLEEKVHFCLNVPQFPLIILTFPSVFPHCPLPRPPHSTTSRTPPASLNTSPRQQRPRFPSKSRRRSIKTASPCISRRAMYCTLQSKMPTCFGIFD